MNGGPRGFTLVTKIVGLLFLAPVSWARLDPQLCGSGPGRATEVEALHRMARERARTLPAGARASAGVRAARDIGNIAVLDDSDGVVARFETFNLDRKNLRIAPVSAAAGAYRYELGEGAFDAEAAANGQALAGLGDDDTREVVLPFSFPFYGKTYSRVFVNSDGNLTFEESDTATTDRSLGRLVAGPPRIAPFLADLDPSRGGSVRVFSQPARVVVTWSAVPEFVSIGTGAANTLQVSLTREGRIEFSWNSIGMRAAVVGIAPGGARGAAAVANFSQPSAAEYTSALAQRFSTAEEVDIVFTALKFYETHEDAYDYLAIFNSLGVRAASGAVAFEVTVRSANLGIGDVAVDQGKQYGSERRLQAVLNMGPLSQYPSDPNGRVASRPTTGDTPLTIIGHEVGHLWLAFASVRDGGAASRPMLGRDGAHWAFTFNSEASILEGTRIRDNGLEARPRFTTVGTVEGYSPLDQYLMGLRGPDDVPPVFYVASASVASSRSPQTGISFDGERRDVRVEDLVRVEGRRTPDHTVAQRRFRIAFVLITPQGTEPDAEQVAQVDRYRREFETFFARATGGAATVDTSLKRLVDLSAAPALGLVAGETGTATLRIARPAATALAFTLRSANGRVTAPGTVTIPAGQATARFEMRAGAAGLDELTAEPADSSYAAAHARLAVRVAGELSVVAVSGDKQQAPAAGALGEALVARVTDVNNVPFAGARVAAVATPGTVSPATAVSDENGLVRFTWTPGNTAEGQLRVAVAGGGAVVFTLSRGSPRMSREGIVNAASFRAGIAAGALQTIFGENLAGGATAAGRAPFTEELAGVRVLVGGRGAKVLFVSDRQINFVAPPDLLGSSADVVVRFGREAATATAVAVSATNPGVFFQTGNVAAAVVSGFAETTAARPAAVGEAIEIYLTGLGEPPFPVQVVLGGVLAEVLYSGAAPGFPGLNQINARVPQGLAPGFHTLVVGALGISSNETRVQIR